MVRNRWLPLKKGKAASGAFARPTSKSTASITDQTKRVYQAKQTRVVKNAG